MTYIENDSNLTHHLDESGAEIWYTKSGKKHRCNAPAAILPDGTEQFRNRGRRVNIYGQVPHWPFHPYEKSITDRYPNGLDLPSH